MISVLVVNHNGGDVLIDSLHRLAQILDPASFTSETLVIDNASTDDSIARVRRELPAVDVLALPTNVGFGAANNRGAAKAQGGRLLLLNSDAWPEPGCIERLSATLDEDSTVAWAAPRLHYPSGEPQFHWAPTTSVLGEAMQKVRNRLEGHSWLHGMRWGQGWYTAACALVRRRAFEAVHGFDEGFFLYFEDVDLCLRLRARGWRLADVADARAIHVKGGSQQSQSLSADGEYYYRHGQLRYYARHRPAWENAFLRRRLRRKFETRSEPERSRLLSLLDAPPPVRQP